MNADELVALFKSRYAVLSSYEAEMWFDVAGRKIAREFHAQGVNQPRDAYVRLKEYLKDPGRTPVPKGYTAPFYKADRENEYRQAHAVFSKQLQDAIDAGWQPS